MIEPRFAGEPAALLSRRELMSASAALALFSSQRAFAAVTRAPRRQVLSFSLQSSVTKAVAIQELTTYLLTIPVESQIEALRVGIANIMPAPYRLGGNMLLRSPGLGL